MITPTGQRLILTSGGTRLELSTVGGVIASLRVDGVQLTEPIGVDERPMFCNGITLAPWPNRVRDGLWSLDGKTQQLDLTEPERHNALHGLLQFTDLEVREITDSSATLGSFIAPQHGWPFALDCWVRYEAVADGLRATHGVTNLSAAPAPYATGAHPYLRIGDVDVETLRVTVPARTYFDVDERLNLLGERPLDGTRFDLREGPLVSTLELDTAYGQVQHVNGSSAWLEAPDGARVELLQDADWMYSQIFISRIFPKDGALGSAIAVEPMTAPPDALNTGEGLRWLDPGESWQGSWGIRYLPAG